MTRYANAERFQGFRLMVLTTPHPTSGRPLVDVVAECVAAGADAIQLRDKEATAEDLWRQARELLPVAREAGAVLIVNDRVDVAVASGAHGAHLGPTDLPVPAARRIAPPVLDRLPGCCSSSRVGGGRLPGSGGSIRDHLQGRA
ncbi:MAG: thiamine phosphate synthase [Gemmatimonadetes bacterium]|nr:thiamine phosphate synthase [Gemmatimonadota bacterium]